MIKITGMDKLKRKTDELGRFSRDIDGHVGEVSYDPSDPGSIERAIQTMEAMIDEKSAPYASNDWIQSLAARSKEHFRAGILEQAAAKRLGGTAS